MLFTFFFNRRKHLRIKETANTTEENSSTVVQSVALSTQSKMVPSVEFACFPCVHLGFLQVLQLSPIVQKHEFILEDRVRAT